MSAVLEQTKGSPAVPITGKRPLTARQQAFVIHYVNTRNATESARLAGYTGEYDTIASMGWENLRKPEIKQAIEDRLKEFQISADEVLAELGGIARFPLEKCGSEGSPVKTENKLKALELAGKFHKLWTDKVETEQHLADSDVPKVAQELYAILREAAERKRLEGQVIDVTPE